MARMHRFVYKSGYGQPSDSGGDTIANFQRTLTLIFNLPLNFNLVLEGSTTC